MTLPRILFAILVAMCVIVGALWLVEEPANSRGQPHPVYDTMQIGGDGAGRLASPLVLAVLFGVLEICFFVGLVALGLRRKERLVVGARSIGLGLLLYLATFLALVRAYDLFAFEGVHSSFLWFPSPSAWMLYGLWPMPLYFVILYVVRFEQWVLRQEDLDDFYGIVEARRARGEAKRPASQNEPS